MPEISIVIPIYNTETHLSQCIRSVLKQTFKDFELILVNDGSKDNSLSVCKEWEEKDCRVKVIDKPNGGVSSARNAGLKEAKGEWISFVDSDDWIEADYLSSLINSLNADLPKIDWVTSGISYQYENGDIKTEVHDYPGLYSSDTAAGMLSIATQKLVTSPVGKLYRTDLIKRFCLSFDNSLSFGEDRDFNIQYLSHCEKCLITSYNGYNYRKDIISSLSTTIQGDILAGDLDYWAKLYQLFRKENFLTDDIRFYLINRLYNFVIDGMSKKRLTPKKLNVVKSKINREFVIENASFINGNSLYKFLFRHRLFSLLNFISLLN